jgi:hypothetical protein
LTAVASSSVAAAGGSASTTAGPEGGKDDEREYAGGRRTARSNAKEHRAGARVCASSGSRVVADDDGNDAGRAFDAEAHDSSDLRDGNAGSSTPAKAFMCGPCGGVAGGSPSSDDGTRRRPSSTSGQCSAVLSSAPVRGRPCTCHIDCGGRDEQKHDAARVDMTYPLRPEDEDRANVAHSDEHVRSDLVHVCRSDDRHPAAARQRVCTLVSVQAARTQSQRRGTCRTRPRAS